VFETFYFQIFYTKEEICWSEEFFYLCRIKICVTKLMDLLMDLFDITNSWIKTWPNTANYMLSLTWGKVTGLSPILYDIYMGNRETCLNRTLNKPVSCINPTCTTLILISIIQWNLSKPNLLGTKCCVRNRKVVSLCRWNWQRFPSHWDFIPGWLNELGSWIT
jgi:hypothetical protein